MEKRNKLWQKRISSNNWGDTIYLCNQYEVDFPGVYYIKFIGYSCMINYWYKDIEIYEKEK